MILACDIGNTNITIGALRGRNRLISAKLPTAHSRDFSFFLRKFLLKNKLTLENIETAVICSVAPKALKDIKKAIIGIISIPIYTVGENLRVPLKNRYLAPKKLGQDRLVNAYMAMRLLGAPIIAIDLGTAITIDIVSEKKEYLGGMILPGLNLCLKSLHNNIQLLPEIKLRKPDNLIGRNTEQCILSGLSYGFGSLIDGLADKIKTALSPKTKVIATGGDSLFIKSYCKTIDYFQPDLLLKGIAQIYLDNKKNT